MMEYWLALTMCLSAAGGEVCELRLAPVPVQSFVACQHVAAMIIRSDPAYRLPLRCSRERPDLPEMPGAIPPGRFA
jgi:hypothetical protein